jgi:hypothetical protein
MCKTSFSTDAYLRLRLGTSKQKQSRGEMKMKTLLAAKEWNKVFFKDGFKHRIKVRAEIRSLGGQEPLFSITGDIQRQAKNNRWMDECGGCIHDEILQHFPDLAPLVRVHLSDENGVPMHAYSNAAYWAGMTKYQQLDLEMLAEHLHLPSHTVNNLLEYIANFWGTDDFDSLTRPEDAWRDACETLEVTAVWYRQAQEANLLLSHKEKESA